MKHDQPLITIGVLNYNGINYLKNTIPSLIGQSYINKEILVVDNGSTDGSLNYLETFKNIRIIKNKENLGYGKGKNIIAKESMGKYILMIDNDIELINKDLLLELLTTYDSIIDISFLSIPLLNINEKDSTIHYGLFYSSIKKSLSIKKLGELKILITGGYIGGIVFFRKNIFLGLGLYDEKYPMNIDDYDMSARSHLMGHKIYVYTKEHALHHGVNYQINMQSWCWKNQYYFSGFNRMIWKNYKLKNALTWFTISSVWIFIKSLRYSFKNISFSPIISFFRSVFYFTKDFRNTLEERAKIQSQRIIKDDVFLKIKPPKCDAK